MTDGQRFRILCIVDDNTRICLCLIADTSLSGLPMAREGPKIFPAAPSTVVAYITAEIDRLKPSTLKRKLVGIRKIHYLPRLRGPTFDVYVDLAIRRARRSKPQRPH